jgi:hypothetical protein
MDRYKYIRLPLNIIPDKMVSQYNLHNIATPDGWIYTKIRCSMYGLKQAGSLLTSSSKITSLSLVMPPQLAPQAGLWTYSSCNIAFSLVVVDNFGVKYVGHNNSQHLLSALEELYSVSTNWAGKLYCGVTINWDSHNQHVNISMPG